MSRAARRTVTTPTTRIICRGTKPWTKPTVARLLFPWWSNEDSALVLDGRCTAGWLDFPVRGAERLHGVSGGGSGVASGRRGFHPLRHFHRGRRTRVAAAGDWRDLARRCAPQRAAGAPDA